MRAALALLLVLLCGPLCAQVQYSGPGARVTAPPLNTLGGTADFERFMRNTTGGQLDIVDRTSGKIGGKTFPVELTRGLTRQAIVTAAARNAPALARAGAVGAVAAAAALSWCKYDTGSWLCDPGQGLIPMTVYCISDTCGFSAVEAYRTYTEKQAAASCASSGSNCARWDITGTPTCTSYCRGLTWRTYFSNGGVIVSGSPDPSYTSRQQQVCPAVPSHQDPLYRVPGGAPGPDGKCPTATVVPALEPLVSTRLEPQLQTQEKLQAAAEDMLQKGVDMTPHASAPKVSGPASVTQEPTTVTTTSPTGQPSTTTTTVTNHITYEGDTFTWYDTTVTTYPDGSSETKTEKPEEPKTDCEKDPTLISCQKPDTPAGPEVGEQTRNVVWSPDGGWGADNGTCPAVKNMPFMGTTIPLDMSVFCTFFAGMRFVIIGLAGIFCALIIIGGIKE